MRWNAQPPDSATSRSEDTVHSEANRARQYLPFAALKGLGNLMSLAAVERQERCQLLEEEEESLNRILASLEPGDPVSVVYYRRDHYEQAEGSVVRIDARSRRMEIDGASFDFRDIRSLSSANHPDDAW